MLKKWLVGMLRKHGAALLAFDYRAAGWVGAPEGYTLSAYAYDGARRGRLAGVLWQWVIDRIFRWLLNQTDHCRKAYDMDSAKIRRRLVG